MLVYKIRNTIVVKKKVFLVCGKLCLMFARSFSEELCDGMNMRDIDVSVEYININLTNG